MKSSRVQPSVRLVARQVRGRGHWGSGAGSSGQQNLVPALGWCLRQTMKEMLI